MVKQAPSLWKIAAMVIFTLSCFGLLLFLWLAFGGPVPFKPKGYRFTVAFREAGQLAQEADVRISGVPVGKVKTVEPDKRTGLAVATIELKSQYAPLPANARAILRQKTLLGETYVELTPGNGRGPKVPENGRLASSQVSDTVELDEILRAFDTPTRKAFQEWTQTQAQAIGDHGQDLNDALGNLGPFADDASTLVDILNRQQGAVTRLVSNTGVVFGALAERDGQLRSLVQNSNRVFQTTAERSRALQAAFLALPTFERESSTTLRRLTRFADNTNPLINQLRPAARELSPTLLELKALAPDLEGLFRDLPPLIDASRTGFPAAARVLEDARPLIGQLDPTTRQLTPMIQWLGLYKRELTSFFANSAAATQAQDPGTNLHYLRTTNPLNPENLSVYPHRIGTNRPNPYRLPGGFDELAKGLAVYEDRHCNNPVPTITNTPLPGLPSVPVPLPVPTPTSTPLPVGTTPTPTASASPTASAVPSPSGSPKASAAQVPPVPTVIPVPTVPPLSPQQLQALIPTDLLNNILKFAFNSGATPAPPCRKQGPFTFSGETTQYPHVKAR